MGNNTMFLKALKIFVKPTLTKQALLADSLCSDSFIAIL